MRRSWALAALLVLAACSDDDAAAPPTTLSTITASTTTTVTTATSNTVTTAAATSTSTVPVSFLDDTSAIDATTSDFAAAGVSAEAAHCIGDGLVHVFGRTKVADLGFGRGRWSAARAGPWNAADSVAVVDTVRVCTADWRAVIVPACADSALSDADARGLFVRLLQLPAAARNC